jgi:hypothetical protein
MKKGQESEYSECGAEMASVAAKSQEQSPVEAQARPPANSVSLGGIENPLSRDALGSV